MLKLISIPLAAVAALIAMAAAPSAAKAGIEYPWCAVYGENTVGATNCGFSTLAQCRATISGLGGLCSENPAYAGAAVEPQPRKRRVRHN